MMLPVIIAWPAIVDYGYADFALTLDYLQTHPDARQQLGRNGRDYVEANYAWDRVMERLLAAVERFGS